MHVVLSAVDEELREDLVVVQEDKLAEKASKRVWTVANVHATHVTLYARSIRTKHPFVQSWMATRIS